MMVADSEQTKGIMRDCRARWSITKNGKRGGAPMTSIHTIPGGPNIPTYTVTSRKLTFTVYRGTRLVGFGRQIPSGAWVITTGLGFYPHFRALCDTREEAADRLRGAVELAIGLGHMSAHDPTAEPALAPVLAAIRKAGPRRCRGDTWPVDCWLPGVCRCVPQAEAVLALLTPKTTRDAG